MRSNGNGTKQQWIQNGMEWNGDGDAFEFGNRYK